MPKHKYKALCVTITVKVLIDILINTQMLVNYYNWQNLRTAGTPLSFNYYSDFISEDHSKKLFSSNNVKNWEIRNQANLLAGSETKCRLVILLQNSLRYSPAHIEICGRRVCQVWVKICPEQ